jgi:hypothetical protein
LTPARFPPKKASALLCIVSNGHKIFVALFSGDGGAEKVFDAPIHGEAGWKRAMTEEVKGHKAPYVPWSTYLNYINSLCDEELPEPIDRSLMSNLSGSIQSILIGALRSTGMIDAAGIPTDRLRNYRQADEQTRKEILREALTDAFPFMFDDSINLLTTTPAKFDERLREAGGVAGSTLDKSASFFLSGAEHTGITVGTHLKKRRPTGRKVPRTKKQKENHLGSPQYRKQKYQEQASTISEKALEYRLVDLMSDASEDEEVMNAIWVIIRFLKSREANANL